MKKHKSHIVPPHHALHYLILLLLLSTSFFAFVRYSGKQNAQFVIGVVMALAYIVWGIFHHLYEDQVVSWKIVVEYSAVALFGAIALWGLLYLI